MTSKNTGVATAASTAMIVCWPAASSLPVEGPEQRPEEDDHERYRDHAT